MNKLRVQVLVPSLAPLPKCSKCSSHHWGTFTTFIFLGIIWSSGYLSDEIRASPSNQYLSVRGPVSRLLLCLQDEYLQWTPEVTGDSALLLPLLYDPGNKVTKTTELCVVLHFSDHKLKVLMESSKNVSAEGWSFTFIVLFQAYLQDRGVFAQRGLSVQGGGVMYPSMHWAGGGKNNKNITFPKVLRPLWTVII